MKYLRLVIKFDPKAAVIDKENGTIDLSVNTDRWDHIKLQVFNPSTGEEMPTRKSNKLSVGPRGGVTLF